MFYFLCHEVYKNEENSLQENVDVIKLLQFVSHLKNKS